MGGVWNERALLSKKQKRGLDISVIERPSVQLIKNFLTAKFLPLKDLSNNCAIEGSSGKFFLLVHQRTMQSWSQMIRSRGQRTAQ